MRAVLVTDLYYEPEDGPRVLYDVKGITLSSTWYKAPLRDRRLRLWGVRRRQDAVPREYRGKAQGADRAYNGTPRGTVGPVERALQEFDVQGLVMGAFGEMSSNVMDLEQAIVEGMARRWRDDGCRSRVRGFGCVAASGSRRPAD